jgi:hypothetical protein
MRHAHTAWILAIATSCSAVVHDDATVITGDRDATSIAIVNVNVVPMDQERVIQSQTVLIDNGHITSIGPASSTPVPAGALRIDAKGKYVLPGLIDMHVHIRLSELDKYLPAGVTSVRNMWGYDELPALMRDIDAGTKKGPHIFSLTAGFDASPPQWPQTQISDDPAAIPALIDRQFDLGFREIKVYQKLSPLDRTPRWIYNRQPARCTDNDHDCAWHVQLSDDCGAVTVDAVTRGRSQDNHWRFACTRRTSPRRYRCRHRCDAGGQLDSR